VSAYDILPANATTDFNPLTGDFTVEAFIYTELVKGIGTTLPIIGKGTQPLSTDNGWRVYIGGSNKLYGEICDGTASSINQSSDVAISKNTWIRVAVVYDRDGNMVLYIDGVDVGSISISAQQDGITNTENLEIGAHTLSSSYFNGLISEVKYSNIARTSNEINNSYLNGFTVDSNTVGLWRPDSYGIFRDEVSGNDLTAVDTTNSSSVYIPRNEGSIERDVSSAILRDTGKVKYNTELSSNCADFDGANDYISINDSNVFSFGDTSTDSPFSISIWVNQSTVSIFSPVINKWEGADIEWRLTITDIDEIEFQLSDATLFGEIRAVSAVISTLNQWAHITGTYDGSGVKEGIKLYLNGINITASHSASGSYTAMKPTDADVLFGEDAGDLIDGKICDIRIHNTELTQTQVKAIMNGTASGAEVGWWPLAEGQGNVSYDVVNNNHGTITNATLSTFWATTQNKFHYNLMYGFSDGAYFDGSTSYCTIVSDDLNPHYGDFSIGFILQTTNNTFYPLDKNNVGGWQIQIYSDGKVKIVLDDLSDNVTIQGNTAIDDGDIHYVEITVNRGGNAIIYIDGIYDGSGSVASIDGNITNSDALNIGRDLGTGTLFYEGNIYKVRYSNKARTADDIWNTYNNGMVVDGYTVSLWDFKNGEGIDLAGRIQGVGGTDGNGNNLTMTNTEHVRLPASIADVTLDVTGQPIEHLAGKWHNGAETTIDFTGGKDTPFINNIYEGHGVFNGSSAYIDCGDRDEFSFGDGSTDNAFSISAWISMVDATHFKIASKFGVLDEWFFGTGGSDTLFFALYDDDEPSNIGRYYDVSLFVHDTEWLYVCGTYDGSSEESGIKIYLNGVRVDNATGSSGNYTAMEAGSDSMYIGRIDTSYAEGYIRDVRIYNGELSASQVTKDYKVGEIASSDNVSLVAEYKLYKDASDSSKNSFHGENTDVTFPKVTIPTSYSFGDNIENPMFKKVEGDVVMRLKQTNGFIWMKSHVSYGVWEFDVKKIDSDTTVQIYLMFEKLKTLSSGYGFAFGVWDEVSIWNQPGAPASSTTLMRSANSVVLPNIWYKIKIVRNETLNQYVNGPTGTFAIYLNGTLLSTIQGSNPFTDTDYVESKYLFITCESPGDEIRNLKINGELINHSEFFKDVEKYYFIGDRENSYNFFERGCINPTSIRPIHKYTKSATIDDTPSQVRLTTTTSSSTSTSTTSSSTTSSSTSTTSTSTSTTSTSLSTSTT